MGKIETLTRLVRELHDIDWGDWSLGAVRKLVEARPGWTFSDPNPTQVLIQPDGTPDKLYLWTGKHGIDSNQYDRMEFPVPRELHEGDAFASLVEALRAVGSPVPHKGTTAAPGLRWRNADRVMILQRNGRGVWLAMHPTRAVSDAALKDAAAMAGELHDADFDGKYRKIPLLTYDPNASLAERREEFGTLFDVIVGSIGLPTIYGGSADGPNIRWRNEHRILVLRGSRQGAWFETHGTEKLEIEEHREFKWGGAFTPSESPAFNMLPYIWQLERDGPGDNPQLWPGGRLALSLAHLQAALELLLAAWIEQLPAQVGQDWATFTITDRLNGHQIMVVFSDDGLNAYCYNGVANEATMEARGWTEDVRRWKASFLDPDERSATQAARLIVGELQAQGIIDPIDELHIEDVSCADMGWFQLFGAGVGR